MEINRDFDQPIHNFVGGGDAVHSTIVTDLDRGMELGDSPVSDGLPRILNIQVSGNSAGMLAFRSRVLASGFLFGQLSSNWLPAAPSALVGKVLMYRTRAWGVCLRNDSPVADCGAFAMSGGVCRD